MYINKLFLKYFGQFHNAEIELKPGMNLVYGEPESGKTTMKESVVSMLYGMDLARGLGDGLEKAESYRPWSERGYSGKAYIEDQGKNYLVERSFLRHNRKTSVLDIQSGRELTLAHKDSLYGKLCPIDKESFENACVIDTPQGEDAEAMAEYLNQYVARYVDNGSPLLDKKVAIAELKALCEESDTSLVDKKRELVEKELLDFNTVDEDLDKIRRDILKVEEELAIETERRKREARKLIDNSKTEEESDEDETEQTEVKESETKEETKARKKQEKEDKKAEKEAEKEAKKDAETDSKSDSEDETTSNIAMFLNSDLGEEEEKVKPLSDQLWFIILVGLFVIGVIYVLVHMLPFTDGVRQIFVVCTALFVVVTIAEGLYAKGAFLDEDDYVPTEDEYKDVLYRMERKAEAFQDVEIDMAFAEEFNVKLDKLRDVERRYLNKKTRRDELREELDALAIQKDESNKLVHAMRLAINTINDIATAQMESWKEACLGNVKEFVTLLTNSKYQDIRLDRQNHLLVVTANGSEYPIEVLGSTDLKDIYYAVRFSLAKGKCNKAMPVILDDVITGIPADRYDRFVQALDAIEASQIILTTSNEAVIEEIKRYNENCNVITLITA